MLFFGAGQANLGAAELLVSALADQGVLPETARNSVWLFDSKGLVVTNRPEGAISDDKAVFAHSGRAVCLSIHLLVGLFDLRRLN